MSPSERARNILKDISYLSLATVDTKGQPWNTPVSAVHDEHYNFYWASWVENEHSKNLALNNKAFIVVYDSTAPAGTGYGVYALVEVELLDDQKDIEAVLSLISDPINKLSSELFMNDNPRRFYKATPKQFWINEEGETNGKYVDIRVEIDLKAKQ